ncbi:MAG TPA: hypothetical protein VK530_10295, partial [Candidatus Acidoferrum sp.]|nr:hypothetical protein [Candidatus Acidoferrum sp.]
MRSLPLLILAIWISSLLAGFASEVTFVPGGKPLYPTGAPGWKYKLGTAEASTPVEAWRTNTFVEDGSWNNASTPFGYVTGTPNDPNGFEASLVTTIPTSTVGNYLSVFMRRTFVVTNAVSFSSVTLGMAVDDGCVIWLNGQEVIPRLQCCQAEVNTGVDTTLPAFNADATTTGESAPYTNAVMNTVAGPLREGTNVLCIQLFNANLTSTELVLDASLTGTIDDTVPTLFSQSPVPGTTVLSLSAIQVNFSEDVQG